MLHAVVMAGGSGTRFWPQSRRRLPKQFLKIGTTQTLIQETVARCLPMITPSRLWVVTGALHADETQRQLDQLSPDQVLVEPCPRNTAPCIGLAAIRLLSADPDAVMLVVPADHVISPSEVFQDAVQKAVGYIQDRPESLVLFGVPPNYPATGFGYIQRGEEIHHAAGTFYKVKAFKEKPDLLTAARYAACDEYYWNCGIFVWRAQTILEELARHQPETHAALVRLQKSIGTPYWEQALAEEFPKMESISIDYAVLERAENVAVLPAPFKWDDVGSWQALARLIPQDGDGNTVEGLHSGYNTEHCIIRSSDDHLVATIGVKNLIVVHTPNATLVADRHDESSVKTLIAELQRRGLDHYL